MIIDSINQQIIRILQANGRSTNRDIARQIGVSEGTVRNRIERLTSEGVIRIAAVINPVKVGLQTTALMNLQVEPVHLTEVGEQLGRRGELTYIGYATGSADIVCLGQFEDNDALFAFLTNVVAKVPGIQKMDTAIILHTVRRIFTNPEGVEVPPFPATKSPDGASAVGRAPNTAPSRRRARQDGKRPRATRQ
ncbi:MAG TPA: Lrp/AsnC family transcriptional regulator [Dehalococcoidia bacterium]|nr:Lrp/AsnC family transcriptional regulator [Dehalococcoidia bacterium]